MGLLYALQTCLVEATSGHTGVCLGLAYVARQTGRPVVLFLPESTLSPERHALLKQLGATVTITKDGHGLQVGNSIWQFANIFSCRVVFVDRDLQVLSSQGILQIQASAEESRKSAQEISLHISKALQQCNLTSCLP